MLRAFHGTHTAAAGWSSLKRAHARSQHQLLDSPSPPPRMMAPVLRGAAFMAWSFIARMSCGSGVQAAHSCKLRVKPCRSVRRVDAARMSAGVPVGPRHPQPGSTVQQQKCKTPVIPACTMSTPSGPSSGSRYKTFQKRVNQSPTFTNACESKTHLHNVQHQARVLVGMEEEHVAQGAVCEKRTKREHTSLGRGVRGPASRLRGGGARASTHPGTPQQNRRGKQAPSNAGSHWDEGSRPSTTTGAPANPPVSAGQNTGMSFFQAQ